MLKRSSKGGRIAEWKWGLSYQESERKERSFEDWAARAEVEGKEGEIEAYDGAAVVGAGVVSLGAFLALTVWAFPIARRMRAACFLERCGACCSGPLGTCSSSGVRKSSTWQLLAQ